MMKPRDWIPLSTDIEYSTTISFDVFNVELLPTFLATNSQKR